jgi:hypothetical protein
VKLLRQIGENLATASRSAENQRIAQMLSATHGDASAATAHTSFSGTSING